MRTNEEIPMRKKSMMMGAAVLLIAGGVASAQLAVAPGQDIQRQDIQRDEMQPSTGSGYGAPYSPRNAPAADATNGLSTNGQATGGQAVPTFEDRWPARAAVPHLPPDASVPNATTGQAQTKSAPASKDVPYSPD
jgi:hypothetical protein